VSRLPDAKRHLGQHFLVDENVLGVIGRLAELDAGDVVLEIGPGAGILTRFLAGRVRVVHAVEIDRSLEERLAADLDPAELDPPPGKLVANLPYNVATPVVVESLDGLPSVVRWTVMVQLEVAERFFARPATKDYGAVSVLLQLATRRTGFHAVSRTVFRPRPNVDSALVAFERTRLPDGWRPLKRVVEGAFAHRRKTLPNSLALAGIASRDDAAAAVEAIGRPANVRAEQLAPPEFVELAGALA
jgi:16S rRNA (adenine1518-N6/adenine1519-N6)-dimethyltransferase